MKRLILIIILLLIITNFYCLSQYNNHYNNWIFPNNNHISFDLNTGMPIFHNNNIEALPPSLYFANIADKDGRLLFYTNGTIIRNKDNLIIENGKGLLAHNAGQDILILPNLKEDNMFFVFTISRNSVLYYSVVDMSFNNGYGKVIKKNIKLIEDIFLKIAAIRHSDKKGFWFVVYSKTKPELYSFLLDSNGIINKPVINEVGIVKPDTVNYDLGTLRFSPSGKKLVSIDFTKNRYIEIFDFNNETGVISNPKQFIFVTESQKVGCEFSPNENYLYLSTYTYIEKGGLYQFDISQEDVESIKNSAVKIYDSHYLGGMQLALDGSIYFQSFFRTEGYRKRDFLSKITYPDRRGKNCHIMPDAIEVSENSPVIGIANIPADYCANICNDESFDFYDMSQANIVLIDSASIIGSAARLTKAKKFSRGAIWFNNKLNLLNGFKCDFNFRISSGNNHQSPENSIPGADGIAFVLQNFSNYTIGTNGGGIGYHGIPNSIAFEFDLYKNKKYDSLSIDDPNGNHFAIQSNKELANSADHSPKNTIFINTNIWRINSDSTEYYVRIIYKPGFLFVYLDTSVSFSLPPICVLNDFYIEDYIRFDRDSSCYVGFTSATGIAVENHDIEEWIMCVKPAYNNTPVTVEQNKFEQKFKFLLISPNPATDYIEIIASSPGPWERARVWVYNLLGVCVLTHPLTPSQEGESIRLDVSGLAAGVYFVRVGGQMYKFVKM